MISNKKQIQIIFSLFSKDGQKFSELGKNFNEEDKFPYHLKRLLNHGYIQKNGDKYLITPLGQNSISNYDQTSFELLGPRPMIATGICCIYKNKVLLHKVQSTNFYNYYHFLGVLMSSGKTYKEQIRDYFSKHLYLENFSQDKIQYHSYHHKIFKDINGNFLYEWFAPYYICTFSDTDFKHINKKSNWDWYTKTEIKKLNKKFPEIDICIFEKENKEIYEYDIKNS